MFRINPAPTFAATVQLTLPGGSEQAPLSLVFKHRGKKALASWVAGAGEAADDAVFLGHVIESWLGVVDDNGAEVAFSPARLSELLDAYPAAGSEIYLAYLAALTEGRTKN